MELISVQNNARSKYIWKLSIMSQKLGRQWARSDSYVQITSWTELHLDIFLTSRQFTFLCPGSLQYVKIASHKSVFWFLKQDFWGIFDVKILQISWTLSALLCTISIKTYFCKRHKIMLSLDATALGLINWNAGMQKLWYDKLECI